MSKKEIKRFRLREDLKLQLLKTIHSFKSTEEPRLKFTQADVNKVLADMLYRGLD